MFRRIMVPLDRTSFAEAALPPAISMAMRHGAELMLVTVWRPAPVRSDSSAADSELWRWEQQCREEDRVYMKDLADRIQEVCGQKVGIRYLMGDPAEELAKLAASGTADLAVISTHARGPLKRALVHSVADRLVRKGGIPLLLVHPEKNPDVELSPGPLFRSILVPLDGSTLSEAPLQPAFLAGLPLHCTEITLLHVMPLQALMTTPGPPSMLEVARMADEEAAAAELRLAEVAERLGPWGFRVNTRLVKSASVAGAILDFAEAHHVDLIAMATHGRGGVARALLGSVADAVVRGSRLPTMLFPPALTAEDRQAAQRGHAVIGG